MNFKKTLAAGLSAALLMSSGLSVSAAEKTLDNMTAEEMNTLIINVEAYRAAYPDLAQAFGDNTDAYVAHYLNVGVYEGRTKGVLFDPLTYAEAYGDVRDTFGYDIPSIISHYVNYGITENRTMGTSHGYTDIAAAETAGLQQYYLPRQAVNYSEGGGNAAGNTGNSAGNSFTGTYSSTPAGSSSPAGSSIPVLSGWNSHHTTSIYRDDGKTLWRVEYYDENNKLQNYSSITNADPNTNSYTENIYSYDEENGKEVLERTDTYVNGELTSSVPGN